MYFRIAYFIVHKTISKIRKIFQKVPIPHLRRIMKFVNNWKYEVMSLLTWLTRSLVNTVFPRTKSSVSQGVVEKKYKPICLLLNSVPCQIKFFEARDTVDLDV